METDFPEALRRTFSSRYVAAILASIYLLFTDRFQSLPILDQAITVIGILIANVGLNFVVLRYELRKIRRLRLELENMRKFVPLPSWLWKVD